MSKMAQHVIVTDFEPISIPESVVSKYIDAYYQKRAPKKSQKIAMAVLEGDVQRLVHAVWSMNGIPLTLKEIEAIVGQVP